MAERYQPDLTLDAKSLVVALINHDNNLSLTPSELLLSGIQPNERIDTIPRNSQAVLAKARNPNGMKVTIYYDRLISGDIVDLKGPVMVTVEDGDTLSSLVPMINQICGLNLAENDLATVTVIVSNDPLAIPMHDDSPAWMGKFGITLFTPNEYVVGGVDDSILCIGEDSVLTYSNAIADEYTVLSTADGAILTDVWGSFLCVGDDMTLTNGEHA